MTTDLEARLRTGLRQYAESVDVAPPPPLSMAQTSKPGRLRRIGLPALVAAAVVLALTVVPAGLSIPQSRSGGGDNPVLPAHFAPHSFVIADVTTAPIDRAVVMYRQYNTVLEHYFTSWRMTVVDADGERYRTVPVGVFRDGSRVTQPFLLSPDGRRVAFPSSTTWWLLDLATGESREFPDEGGGAAMGLAWSPDGHRIVYSPYRGNTTVVWDIEGGAVTTLDTGAGPAIQAAFAPDGRNIALELGNEVAIVDGGGHVVRRVPLEGSDILAGPASWSPDGRYLATVRPRPGEAAGVIFPAALRLIAVDGRSSPREVSLHETDVPEGWRSDSSFVVFDGSRLVEVSTVDGARTTLAEVGAGVTQLQLATGLLAGLVVTDEQAVDRGPWPLRARVLAGLLLALVALVALPFVLRFAGRRPRYGRRPRWDPDVPIFE
jgi:dipeptidyl aminopeptidase/acylaminoacyl peptidase